MRRRKTLSETKIIYNKAVVQYLLDNAPGHAQELNACGNLRGWWDTIEYFRTVGKSPEECAKVIMTYNLN